MKDSLYFIQMKNFKKNILLFISIVFFFTIAVLFSSGIHDSSGLEKIAERIEKYLRSQEKELRVLMEDSALVRKLNYGNGDISLLNDLNKLEFGLLVYKNDSLLFWSSNDIALEYELVKNNLQPEIVKTEIGYFEMVSKKYNELLLVGFIPIKYEYPVHNQYLQNNFSVPGVSEKIKISLQPLAHSHQLHLPQLKNNVYIFFDENYTDVSYWSVLFSCFGIIGMLILFYGIAENFRGIYGFAFLFFSLLAIRWVMLQFHFPSEFDKLQLFQPQYYASSGIAGSFGDFLLNVLFVFYLSLFFYLKTSLPKNLKENIYTSFLIPFTVYGIIFLLADWLTEVLKSLVIDSQISFEINNIFSLNLLSGIWILSIIMILFCFFLLTHRLIRYLHSEISILPRFHYFGIAVSLLIYFLITIDWLTILVAVFVLVYLWMLYKNILPANNFQKLRFRQTIPFLLLFSIALSLLLNFLNEKKEKTNRQILAVKLAKERDPVFEYVFTNSCNEVATDSIAKNYFGLHIVSSEKLNEHLIANYLSGFFTKKYDIEIYTCDTSGDEFTMTKELEELKYFPNPHKTTFTFSETNNPYLFHFSEEKGSYVYYAKMPAYFENQLSGFLQIEFRPKKSLQANVYPELLLDENVKSAFVAERYDYAIYKNGTLIDQQGTFSYNAALPRGRNKEKEFDFYPSPGFSHLIYHAPGSVAVMVSEKENSWLIPLALFSYVFLILLVFVLFLFFIFHAKKLFRSILPAHFFSQTSLAFKIQVALISTLVFSFIVVASVTIYNLRKHYETHHTENLLKKLKTLASELEWAMNSKPVSGGEIKNEIKSIGTTHAADVNVFNNNGTLLASSQPEIFSKGLLSRQIAPYAYFYLTKGGRTIFVQQEKIGRLKFLSAYSPVKDKNGRAIAFLNLPYYSDEKDLQNEISAFFTLLINVNVLLLLLAVVSALLISKSVIQPLKLIGERMNEVELGRKNELLEWKANDEIGALVKEYNKMIEELENSALQLAKSERESAWREMAKQVAHEIKNPLTTMRLRIQLLQKAILDNVPHLNEMTGKTSEMLIEQIDNLNNIATAFSSFAQMPKAVNEIINLNELLKNTTELFFENEKKVKLELDLPEEISYIISDKNQLLQVMNNLLKNGIQSIPDDREGKIKISLKDFRDHFLITVSDNGSGIASELKEKIFMPNFTTKSSGTGLGLAITKNIIENMDSKIYFESEENKGTTFFVELLKD